jgi:hypothetical protein
MYTGLKKIPPEKHRRKKQRFQSTKNISIRLAIQQKSIRSKRKIPQHAHRLDND